MKMVENRDKLENNIGFEIIYEFFLCKTNKLRDSIFKTF